MPSCGSDDVVGCEVVVNDDLLSSGRTIVFQQPTSINQSNVMTRADTMFLQLAVTPGDAVNAEIGLFMTQKCQRNR